jgi:hypothetical protein
VRYTDNRPALLEKPLGAGRVLTTTTPVSDSPNDNPWNLLPVGEAWPFGILVHQMMFYLAGSSEQQFNYVAGQTAVLQIPRDSPYKEYLITAPDGLKFPQPADADRHELSITSTDQVGNYRAEAGGRESGVARGFSVNLALRQTDLTRAPKEKLGTIFGKADYRIARTKDDIERDISSGRVGRKLFGPLIVLLVIVLALEQLVANRFYRE